MVGFDRIDRNPVNYHGEIPKSDKLNWKSYHFNYIYMTVRQRLGKTLRGGSDTTLDDFRIEIQVRNLFPLKIQDQSGLQS